MAKRLKKQFLTVLICVLILLGMNLAISRMNNGVQNKGSYTPLPPAVKEENPLAHLNADFYADKDFSTNLPIVILSVSDEFPVYKSFSQGADGESIENVVEGVNPWISGQLEIIENGSGENNTLRDTPSMSSTIRIKERGHSSISFQKKQYYVKLCDEAGENLDLDLMGMGLGSGWVLNGTMSDKSLVRNYTTYRIASEIGGNSMGLDSRYCEVFFQDAQGYRYQGVYLLMENVDRGDERIDIAPAPKKKNYTSYIIRRDRFTNFDPMLETYGRLSGQTDTWIGIKYPGAKNLTQKRFDFIAEDFSRTERVIYSDDPRVFLSYDKLIDTKNFIDYMIINEFFANYDSGEHSNYMYKNSGGKLHVGPVWDFDQALNNDRTVETNNDTVALHTKSFYKYLIQDKEFVRKLNARYIALRNSTLSDAHVFAVMEEAVNYLENARHREYFRWDSAYTATGGRGVYVLKDYELGGLTVSRYNTDFDQELYVIRTYIRKHGDHIALDFNDLMRTATLDSSFRSYNSLLLLATVVFFLVPSIIISKGGRNL